MPLTDHLPPNVPLPRRLTGLLARRRALAVSDALIEARLDLPICHDTPEETGAAAVFESGRDLARQSAWDELTALIAHHDREGDLTDAGTPLAELLSAGARADLVAALAHAAHRNRLSEGAAALHAIEDIAEDLADPELGHGGAILAAEMLMAAGWAYYDQGMHRGAPERYLAEFKSLFSRAEAFISTAEGEDTSPALAATRCNLLAGHHDASRKVVEVYEHLIATSPAAPGHLRAFGLHLLPHWFGTHATLEVQARRAAVATQGVWGAGGYSWVWMDALSLDPAGFAFFDIDLFLEGLDDILARRSSQHYVNLIASCLSRYLELADHGGPDRAQSTAIKRFRARLIRGRLQELHPWVWALGPQSDPGISPMFGRPSATLIEEGKRLAHDAIASVFASELRAART